MPYAPFDQSQEAHEDQLVEPTILGVGWDVGGWIGRKQGVAVATLNAAGVTWLGSACSFRLSDLGSPDWTLTDLIRQAWSAAPADVLDRYRIVLAVDAPFGFPRAFKQLLDSGQAPAFQPDGREIDNPLAYRDCDRWIHEVFKKKPLSASFDKLGNNATVAMHHVRRLATLHGARALPFDPPSADAHTIIEVYPALSKVPKDSCCYPAIERLLPTNSVAGTDECDACVCALMALAFASGGNRGDLPPIIAPGKEVADAARAEGWIYYPSREWLTSGRASLRSDSAAAERA